MSDTAMNALLKFLHVLFIVLGHFSPKIASLVDLIPSSVYSLGKILGHSLHYTKYVVCPKRHRLYTFKECVTLTSGRQCSKTCTFVRFPNHPQHRFRRECGHLLLHYFSGRQMLHPLKAFPYRSLSFS